MRSVNLLMSAELTGISDYKQTRLHKYNWVNNHITCSDYEMDVIDLSSATVSSRSRVMSLCVQ